MLNAFPRYISKEEWCCESMHPPNVHTSEIMNTLETTFLYLSPSNLLKSISTSKIACISLYKEMTKLFSCIGMVCLYCLVLNNSIVLSMCKSKWFQMCSLFFKLNFVCFVNHVWTMLLQLNDSELV